MSDSPKGSSAAVAVSRPCTVGTITVAKMNNRATASIASAKRFCSSQLRQRTW